MTTALLLLLMAVLANLPWVSERWLGFIPGRQSKQLWQRLVEGLIGYALLLALAYAVEQAVMGQVWKQGWEFYSITLAMFIVFAFPGFIYRVLWK